MEGNINDKVAAATERAFALINADGWKVEKEADGGVLSTKPVEGSSVNAVRAVGIIHGKKAQDLQERLWGFRKEDWKKWSDDIEEWKIVQEIDDTTRVIYQLNSLPWPLWSRDVVFVQKKFEKEGKFYLLFFSTEHSDAPRDDKKYVRATLTVSIYQLEPEGDNTKITRVIHLDPEGSIPTSLVNSKSAAVLTIVKQLNEL